MIRLVELLRAGVGVADLMATETVARFLGGPPGGPAHGVLRVLGFRQVTQASATMWNHSPAVHVGAGVVDALHAASMVVLALADEKHRRQATRDLLVASTFAALEFVSAARLARRS